MHRFLRGPLALLLVALALGLLVGKAWLASGGPYLEALPPFPFCLEAEWALADNRVGDALELAEAGDCANVRTRAEAAWSSLSAVFARCVSGVWTGRGEDVAAVGCAVASDLVVFGDVRDLTRQGVAWGRGDPTDPVLVALSVTGLALTFAPQVGVGNDVLKVARRAGTLSNGLAGSVTSLARRGAWRPLTNLVGDAGRIATKLGPGRATRALAYADDADELAALARFVDAAPAPTLALRWGGKQVVRLADEDTVVRAAVTRGPRGVQLVAERGARALLSRQPLAIALAKGAYRNPEALLALAAWVLRWVTWPLVALVAATLTLTAAMVRPRRRRDRQRPRGRREHVRHVRGQPENPADRGRSA